MDEFVDFGEAVLRNLDALVPLGTTRTDLALELGLCAWMHRYETDVDEALALLWEVRRALLVAGRLDPAIEPIPFEGREPQSSLLNLVIYLRTLLARAESNLGCGTPALIEQASGHLASPAPGTRFARRSLRERRSS